VWHRAILFQSLDRQAGQAISTNWYLFLVILQPDATVPNASFQGGMLHLKTHKEPALLDARTVTSKQVE
jgi:hypothetical protein